MTKNKQSGIIHLTLIISIVLVAVIGFAGWTIHNRGSNKTVIKSTIKTSTITSSVPETIQTKSDIQSAINVTDSTAIDSDLDTSGFDSDIASLR